MLSSSKIVIFCFWFSRLLIVLIELKFLSSLISSSRSTKYAFEKKNFDRFSHSFWIIRVFNYVFSIYATNRFRFKITSMTFFVNISMTFASRILMIFWFIIITKSNMKFMSIEFLKNYLQLIYKSILSNVHFMLFKFFI